MADGAAAIEMSRQALLRVLLGLVAMAGKAEGYSATLPRRLHRAILRLLRPAEAAARRLIIALTATPQWRVAHVAVLGAHEPAPAVRCRDPLPVRPRSDRVVLPLFDRVWPARLRLPVSAFVPRITLPGYTTPFQFPPAPAPDDPLSARRLLARLDALARALDDMPRQALRFARWQSRQKLRRSRGKRRRLWPLRTGWPLGSRLRATHEVFAILAKAHELAFCALERRDTS